MVISEVFAFDVGFMFFVLGMLAEMVVKEARLNHPSYHSDDLKTMERMVYPRYVAGALFLISVVPSFWISTPLGHLRSIIWASALIVFLAYYIRVSFIHNAFKAGRGEAKMAEASKLTEVSIPRKEQQADLTLKRVFDPVDERWVFVHEMLTA